MSNLQFRRPSPPGRPSWRSGSDPRIQVNSGVDDYMRGDIDKQCNEIAQRTAGKLVKLFEFPEEKCDRFRDMMVGIAQYHYYQIANKVYTTEQNKARTAVDGAEKSAEEAIKAAEEKFRQDTYDLNQWVDQYQKAAEDAEDRKREMEKDLAVKERAEEQLREAEKDNRYLKGEVDEKDQHVKVLQEEINEWKEKYEKVEGDKLEADAVEMQMRHKKEAMERELRQHRIDGEEKQRELLEAVGSAEEAKKEATRSSESSKEELQEANHTRDELRARLCEVEGAKRGLEREKAELDANIDGLREELQKAGNDARAEQKRVVSKLRKEKGQQIEKLHDKIGHLTKEVDQRKARHQDSEEQKTVDQDTLASLKEKYDAETGCLNSEIKRLTNDKERLEEEVGLLRAKEKNDDKLKNVEKELANLKAWRADKAKEIEVKSGQLNPDAQLLLQVVPPVLRDLVRLQKGTNLSDHGISPDHQLDAFGRLLGPLEKNIYVKLRGKVEALGNRSSEGAKVLKEAIDKVLQGMGDAHAEYTGKNQAREDSHDAQEELMKLKKKFQGTEVKRKELDREKNELKSRLNESESNLKKLSKEKDDLELQMRHPESKGKDLAELQKTYSELMAEKAALEIRCREKTQQMEDKDKELKEARDHIRWMEEQSLKRDSMTKQYENGLSQSSEMLAKVEVSLDLAREAKKTALERAARAEEVLQGIRSEIEPPQCRDLKAEVRELVKLRKARESGQEAIKKLDELQQYQDAVERILETNAALDLKQSADIMDMYAQRATRMCSQFEQRRREQPNVEDPELFSKMARSRKEGRNLEKVRDRLRAGVRFVEELLDKSKTKVRPKGTAAETEPSTPMSLAPDTPSRLTDMVLCPMKIVQRSQTVKVHGGGPVVLSLVNLAALLCMLVAIVAEGQKYGQWKSANSYTRGLYAEQRHYMCAGVPQMVFFTDWISALVG